jgi:hypothetical protein
MLGRINGSFEFLPSAGVLSDGRTVSNYNLLPPSILAGEGWKEVITAGTGTVVESAVDNGDTITVTYTGGD